MSVLKTTVKRQPLTPKQRDFAEALLVLARTLPPGLSVTEVAKGMGTSLPNAHRVLCALKEKGWVDWTVGRYRSLHLLYKRVPERKSGR